MKTKTLAALVGSISLGVLAAGCATNKASEQPATAPAATTTDKGAQGSCGAGSCSGKSAPADGAATTPTQDKGSQGSCGAGSCGGTKQ